MLDTLVDIGVIDKELENKPEESANLIKEEVIHEELEPGGNQR